MKIDFARLRLAALRAALGICPIAFVSMANADVTPPGQPFTLSWEMPSSNVDGTPLVDLLGYYIYVGDSPDGLMPMWFVPADLSNLQVAYVATGDYYFAISAVNADGVESDRTGPVMQTVQ